MNFQKSGIQPSFDVSSYSKGVGWNLAMFPEGVIGEIGSYSGLEALISLWNSGNSLLRQKLRSPQCLLHITYGNLFGRKLSDFPSVLREWKGIIGISNFAQSGSHAPFPNSEFNWRMFPKSMNHIDFFLSAKQIKQPNFAVINEAFPSLSSISIHECSDGERRDTVPTDILTDLKLPALRVLCMTVSQIISGNGLPPTLESLQLHTLEGKCSAHIFSHLTSLRTLSIPLVSTISISQGTSSFPSSLTSLNIQNCTNIIHTDNLKTVTAALERSRQQVHFSFFEALPELQRLYLHSAVLLVLYPQGGDNPSLPACWNKLIELKVDGPINRAFALPTQLISLKLDIPTLTYPERLPRTIRRLELPNCVIPVRNKVELLPPRLATLIFATLGSVPPCKIHSDQQPEEKFPFPPSLTVLKSTKGKPIAISPPSPEDVSILKRLPETVLYYAGTKPYARMPERLLQSCRLKIEGTNFVNYFNAIASDNVPLLEHIDLYWKDLLAVTAPADNLHVAIVQGALMSHAWLLKSPSCSSLYTGDSSLGRSLIGFIMNLIDQNQLKLSLAMLNVLVEAGVHPAILGNHTLLSCIVESGNLQFLKLLEKGKVKNWDIGSNEPDLHSILTQRILSKNPNARKMTDFLLESGARVISFQYILSRSVCDRTLEHLERLKTISKRYEIGYVLEPFEGLARRMATWEFDFFIPTLEWLLDPSNHFNIPMDNYNLSTIYSALFQRICENVSSLESVTMDHTGALIKTPILDIDKKKFQKASLNNGSILSMSRWFSEKGVDIILASASVEYYSLFEFILLADSLELLEFSAGLPSRGLERMLYYWVGRASGPTWDPAATLDLQKLPKNWLEDGILRAEALGCSEPVLRFLKEYKPADERPNASTSDFFRAKPDPSQNIFRLLFNHPIDEMTPLQPSEESITSEPQEVTDMEHELQKLSTRPKRSKPHHHSSSSTTPHLASSSSSKPQTSFGTTNLSIQKVDSPTSAPRFGKGTTFGSGSTFGSTKASPSTLFKASGDGSPSASPSKPPTSPGGVGQSPSGGKSTFGSGKTFGKGATFGSPKSPP
jgi:hypothetical protein